MFYEEQKREKVKAAKEEVLKADAEKEKLKKEKLDDVSEYSIDEPSEDPVEEVDCDEQPVKEQTDLSGGFSPTSSSEPKEEIKKGSEVSDDIKESLESDDPWMQRKNE